MTYTLYHKDIPVLAFKIEEDEITEVSHVFNAQHLPVGMFLEHERDVSQKQQFRAWWKSRAIPASRQNLRDALERLGNITTERLVTQSFGLSLSDHYWAKPSSSDITWKDINFFEHDFSEDVGKALFGTLNVQDLSSISLLSPDNTSDGWLKKKWIIDDGERVLLKGGSGESQQEPFNEVLAAEICRRLRLSHVDYAIIKDGWEYFSACKDFVTVDTEFIPATRIYNLKKYTGGVWDKYSHFKECCAIAGISNFAALERQFCGMFIVDYIMANKDRHFGNFGFLRNPNTLAWQELRPCLTLCSAKTKIFLQNAARFSAPFSNPAYKKQYGLLHSHISTRRTSPHWK